MAGRMLLQGATGFARLVTWVSLIGLVLGVAVLTLVVNVMNGFDHELRQRLLGSVPHITINQTPLDPSLAQAVAAAPEVAQASKYFQGFAVLSAGTSMQPVTMIGLAAADLGSMEQLQGLMRRGSLDDLQRVPNAILLGEPLARYQGLSLGDPVVLGVSIAQGDSVALRWLRLNLAGTFEMGAETDYSTVLVNLDQQTDDYWQALGQLGTRITLHQPMQASSLGARLSQIEASAAIETWEQTYGELFQAVRMEKSLMFFLLLLVVAIAGFNVIAGQSMVVLHKRSQIAMLRTIGATRGFVLTLFVFQGAFVAVTGTLGGLLLGLLMTSQVNELVDFLGEITGQHLLDGSFFAAVPTRLVWLDLTLIGVLSLSIALLSAWLPARGASQLPPARHLH
jgi:lipoprotein-releasing system permease protein